MQRVMRDNALSFAGLAEGEGARQRLLHFYASRNLDPGLPVAAPRG